MATFTNQTKNSASYSNLSFHEERLDLLIGDGFKLLIEDPWRLDIEPTRGTSFIEETKNTASYSNQTKN
jgi:hypothetical protein